MVVRLLVIIHSDNPAFELRSSFTYPTNLLHYNLCMYDVCLFLLPTREVCRASETEADDKGVVRRLMVFLTLDVSNLNDSAEATA